MKLFGFEISKKIDKRSSESGGLEIDNTIKSFAIPSQNDGTMLLPSSSAAGYYGQILDIDGTSFVNEKDLILKYRAAAGQPECDNAIADITNASIISDSKGAPVKLDLDTVDLPQKVKERIFEEFNIILQLLDFNFTGYDIFRRWYIDGKIYFHLQIDSSRPKDGIKGIIQIDPLKIKKIKEISTTIDRVSGIKSNKITAEYFLYSDDFTSSTTGVKIDPNAIVYVPSGVLDETGKVSISYLHKSIKLVNQLRMMEDSLVIYRVARAPERRIFYIDVGNLPKGKAEEYVQGLMAKYRNKLVYNAADGEIRDDRKSMCLTMDTKVPLLDGRTLYLSEITEEYNSGKQLWVYSCDPVTGKFAPGLVSWAGVTRKDTDVMRLTLDNGKTIICTLDHKFPVWNKGFVRADELIVGESMIPLRANEIILIDKIEYLKETIDTGCLTVDGDEIYHDYHTFALDAGIYTKNSILEDFFLPRRDGCFHLNTSIKLLDGRDLPLIDLIQEHNEGKQNWVYSVSPDGTIVPGKISWAGITRRNTEVLNVYLDNGEVVTATPDHKFILRTGEKIEAKDLTPGCSLMPFNTRMKQISKHRVSKSNHNHTVLRIEYLSDKIDVGTLTIDENHDYHDYHNFALSSGIFVMNSKGTEITTLPGGCLAMDTLISLLDGRELSILDIESEMKADKQLWTYSCDEFTGEVKPGLISWAGQTQTDAKVMKITLDNGESLICTPDHKFPIYDQGFVAAEDLSVDSNLIPLHRNKKKESVHNHRIVKIEYLDYTIPVGTLTIDKDELIHNHHTFALSCGIFTKNSNLSEIEDILFFQKKLYRSLNVPSARLEADSLFVSGRSSEISREEVKFQKFVSRLRKKFSMMFSDMLRVQCILKGIITLKDWPSIRECMGIDFIEDNFYSELKDSEILKNRLEVLELIQPSIGIYYSNKWVRSNVLNMSEHDVIRMNEEIDEEKTKEEKTPTETEEPAEAEAGGEAENEVTPEKKPEASEEEPTPEEGEEGEEPGKEWSINMNKRA